MLSVNRRKPFTFIQMKPHDINGFSQVTASLKYKDLSYFSMTSLLHCSRNPYHISYKHSFTTDYKQVRLKKSRHKKSTDQVLLPIVYAKVRKHEANVVSVDIESMYRYMPQIAQWDILFYVFFSVYEHCLAD